MKKNEKLIYYEKPTVAYWSGCGGIEIKCIEYGIDDYVIFVADAWRGGNWKNIRRVKIIYSDDEPYFKFRGWKIPFNECIRANL